MAFTPPSAADASPAQNRLLGALPAALASHLQWVPMPLGRQLHGPGEPLLHAYFPTTAVVSLHCVMADGAMAETAGVGSDGMVGVSLFMGGGGKSSSAVVQIAGHGYRLDRHWLQQAFEHDAGFQQALLRYTQVLINQIAQAAACYRHHSIDQQLSRWLLATVERVPSADDVVMTHELAANVLGVRRESITQAAGKLRDAGYIRYRRGHISVLDCAGLRLGACECYAAVKRETSRLQPDAPG